MQLLLNRLSGPVGNVSEARGDRPTGPGTVAFVWLRRVKTKHKILVLRVAEEQVPTGAWRVAEG